MKNKLIKFHFIIFLILVVNFIITISFDVGLNNYIKIGLKILLYGSALIGAVLFFKPFKFITAYFSLYVISPFLIFLAVVTGRSFSKLLISLFLELIFTSKPIYIQNNYEIHNSSEASTCCLYEIYEVDYLFARKKGEFNYVEYEIINKGKENEINAFLRDEKIKSIKIQEKNIFINFDDNSTRRFEFY